MKKLFVIALMLTTIFSACNMEEMDNHLELALSGLEDLGADYVYEGWIIVDGAPVSTGTFTVDADGAMSKTTFEVDATQIDAATAFVLSIEPTVDPDPAPSDVKILSGDFSGSTATVNTGIVGDFATSTGKFILATPTTTATTDELSGVWFLDAGTAGLDLPELGAGWAYEGWAVIGGTPLSTGTFTSVNAADAAAPYSGSDASGPAFPGEDFVANAPSGLTFPVDLTGMPIVVSIEPVPDNSTAPFTLKPLSGSAPTGAVTGTAYDMDNNSTGFPTGTATKTVE